MIKKLIVLTSASLVVLTAHAATNRPSGYTTICKTNQSCSVSKSTNVAFGAAGKFVYKVLDGSFSCDVSTFGSDPNPSKSVKECSIPKDGSSGTGDSGGSDSGGSDSSGSDSGGSDSGGSSSSGSSGTIGSSCTSSTGNVTVKESQHPKGIVVKSGETFDGQCKTYTPDWGDCGQAEGQQPVFRVEGGTLKNVIVGQRGDGIHVRGNATIENITWPNVCEDALTIKEQATVTISNITGYDASDKFFQANAKSTVVVKNAKIHNVGKVLREKGGSCYPVKWTIENSEISKTKEGVFRSDCSGSEFELINVKLTDVPKVCIGENKSCKY